jgi:hypothetical protein
MFFIILFHANKWLTIELALGNYILVVTLKERCFFDFFGKNMRLFEEKNSAFCDFFEKILRLFWDFFEKFKNDYWDFFQKFLRLRLKIDLATLVQNSNWGEKLAPVRVPLCQQKSWQKNCPAKVVNKRSTKILLTKSCQQICQFPACWQKMLTKITKILSTILSTALCWQLFVDNVVNKIDLLFVNKFLQGSFFVNNFVDKAAL